MSHAQTLFKGRKQLCKILKIIIAPKAFSDILFFMPNKRHHSLDKQNTPANGSDAPTYSPSSVEASDLDRTEELYDFLQGKCPDGYKLARGHMPKLTEKQAWTVIWYLGNQYWQVPDFIGKCCVCGRLYDSERSGDCLDFGKAPYHFCDCCMDGDAYAKKRSSKLNPHNAGGMARELAAQDSDNSNEING